MREILFCGKRIDNGCWVSGYHIKDGVTGKHFIAAEGSLLHESDKVGEEGLLNFVAFEVDEDTISVNMDSQWTPVEDRLPEVDVDVEEIIEDDDCPEYIVTVDGASESTVLKYSPDGTWFDENGYTYDVVAWRPLPSPYRPWNGRTDKNIITRIIERLNHLCALNSGCGAIFGNTKEKECYYKGCRDAFEQAIEEIQTIYDRADL